MSRLKLNELFVSERKVKHYLLNTDHPDGGSKAKFFINFGFNSTRWKAFARAICRQAANNSIKSTEKTADLEPNM